MPSDTTAAEFAIRPTEIFRKASEPLTIILLIATRLPMRSPLVT